MKSKPRESTYRGSAEGENDRWEQGYIALKKMFPGFADVFEEVEQLIMAQIEMEQ